MAHPIMSLRKAHSLSVALFLVGLAIVTFFNFAWWPSIMIVIGIPIALRQFLLGRVYDMIVTLIVSGTSNQVLPALNANAISWSPMP